MPLGDVGYADPHCQMLPSAHHCLQQGRNTLADYRMIAVSAGPVVPHGQSRCLTCLTEKTSTGLNSRQAGGALHKPKPPSRQ